jgi:hypothetical protein
VCDRDKDGFAFQLCRWLLATESVPGVKLTYQGFVQVSARGCLDTRELWGSAKGFGCWQYKNHLLWVRWEGRVHRALPHVVLAVESSSTRQLRSMLLMCHCSSNGGVVRSHPAM